jgi:2-polyprenyl-3-methyl-5-hydroxy-6-metoxy-1,4-benzoquinol methylase
MVNKIQKQLAELNIIDEKRVVPFYPKVRDRDDVSVLKCNKSGVIFLSTSEHIENSYYADKKGTSYWSSETREQGLKETHEDDHRRAEQFKMLVSGKKYLDVGSGMGGVLDFLKPHVTEIAAVEPQAEIRNLLNSIGYKVHESVAAIPDDKKYDVVSLFHVFEHLTTPLQTLKEIHSKMSAGGQIIIEVPHSRDALITVFNLDAFKKFTFWGEHLILHTRDSLTAFLKAAGFKNISVKGFQRYPLANHLYWLQKGEPGGQNKLPEFRNRTLEEAYAHTLDNIDQTDTIIAIAEK